MSGAEDIMRNAGLDGAQAGIKIAGRNINNLRHGVAPLGSSCAITVWYSRLLPLASDVGWLLSAALSVLVAAACALACQWQLPAL